MLSLRKDYNYSALSSRYTVSLYWYRSSLSYSSYENTFATRVVMININRTTTNVHQIYVAIVTIHVARIVTTLLCRFDRRWCCCCCWHSKTDVPSSLAFFDVCDCLVVATIDFFMIVSYLLLNAQAQDKWMRKTKTRVRRRRRKK